MPALPNCFGAIVMTELPENIGRALALLGMARRANELIIGQDRVLRALSSGRRLFMVAAADCSQNVLRKTGRLHCARIASGLSRESLGMAVGVGKTQIVALPAGSGFVKKLEELLTRGEC
jgi:ribosomal protein L7Ae-like RNA K-turn-binding protein